MAEAALGGGGAAARTLGRLADFTSMAVRLVVN